MALSKELSHACFRRDGFKCRHCNNRNGLHPHHVVYKSQMGLDMLSNLLTLCACCHRGHHDGFLHIEVIDFTEDNVVVRFTRKGNWKPT